MFISKEEIAGLRKGELITCWECLNDTELDDIQSQEDILTQEEIGSNDSGFYFCDVCKKAL